MCSFRGVVFRDTILRYNSILGPVQQCALKVRVLRKIAVLFHEVHHLKTYCSVNVVSRGTIRAKYTKYLEDK